MNEDIIQDLKQFIAVTVSQRTTSLREDIVGDIRDDIKILDEKLSKKIDDLSDSVAEAISSSNDDVDSQLKDHDRRISKLERKVV